MYTTWPILWLFSLQDAITQELICHDDIIVPILQLSGKGELRFWSRFLRRFRSHLTRSLSKVKSELGPTQVALRTGFWSLFPSPLLPPPLPSPLPSFFPTTPEEPFRHLSCLISTKKYNPGNDIWASWEKIKRQMFRPGASYMVSDTKEIGLFVKKKT